MNTTTFNQGTHLAQSTPTTTSETLTHIPDLAGRIALASIFLLAGINKVQYYEGNAQFLASGGLPEFLLPLVIVFELVGAIALVVGFKVRIVALAFATFSVATAALYHNNLADQIQFLMFFKNIAIAGGLLVLAANGAKRFSLDARK